MRRCLPGARTQLWLPAAAKSGPSFRATLEAAHDAGYFTTTGLHLLKGRAFDERDAPEGTAVAIVNQTLAELLWPGRDSNRPAFLGLAQVMTCQRSSAWCNSSYRLPGEQPQPHFYLPFRRAYAEVVHSRRHGCPRPCRSARRDRGSRARRDRRDFNATLGQAHVRPQAPGRGSPTSVVAAENGRRAVRCFRRIGVDAGCGGRLWPRGLQHRSVQG